MLKVIFDPEFARNEVTLKLKSQMKISTTQHILLYWHGAMYVCVQLWCLPQQTEMDSTGEHHDVF